MTVDEIVEGWTQAEREQARGQLAKLFVGLVRLDAEDNWCLPMSDTVPAGETRCLTMCPQIAFMPRKLFISEPSLEHVVTQCTTSYRTVTTGRLWWRKERQIVDQDTKVISKNIVTVPRSLWRVHTVLVGQRLQFPTYGTMSGDMFGPDSTLGFSDKCSSALSVAIVVSHEGKEPLPFSAVVMGTRAQFPGEAA